MSSSKFSEIAHRHHYLCSPLDPSTIEELLPLLELKSTDKALDIGCGKGRLLVEIADRYGCSGTGIDLEQGFIAAAKELAAQRGVADRVEFVCADAQAVDLDGGFALACCVGSTHVYGSLRETITALRALLTPSGLMLLGEGFWKRPPDPEYLERLSARADDYTSHLGNMLTLKEEGLEVVYSHESTLREWDDFEGLYARSIHDYVSGAPEDPEALQMLEKIERWENTVARWGRDTLGFGLYLARPFEARRDA